MRLRGSPETTGLALLVIACLWPCPIAAQLDEHCTVSILNRTVQVRPDSSWVLPAVPANMGRIRARVTCVDGGLTRSGQSDWFVVPVNGTANLPPLDLGSVEPVPTKLVLTSPAAVVTSSGATLQLVAKVSYSDGRQADVTAGATGTNYTSSSSKIARVSEAGVVTAVSSGTALISAMNDGATGLLRISVVLSGDTDGDGIPDDVELANGLNPNDPVDALEDYDRDGLTNAQELQLGTDLRNGDTDGDTLPDGREVAIGTDPLVFDTDGDGLGDGLEVATGSDPLNPNSYNLALALASIDVTPASLTLVFNTLLGEASRPLRVTGHLIDGRTLDLTSRQRGTNYLSSNLAVVSFGTVDGQIFAGQNGTATVTVSNNGQQALVPVTVRTFSPQGLSRLTLDVRARGLDVAGDSAYVVGQPISGGGGGRLAVVDVTDRRAPALRSTLNLTGVGEKVKVVGSWAYVAAGTAGLVVVDVADPIAPRVVGTVDTPGYAWDIAVRGNRAYLADGVGGLRVIDITTPQAPLAIASYVVPATTALTVDVSGTLAVVGYGVGGVRAVDVSNPAMPFGLGSLATSNAQDVLLEAATAYLADGVNGGLRVLTLANPSAPAVLATVPSVLVSDPRSLAKAGDFVFSSDFGFNGVAIMYVGDPANPVVRARANFGGGGSAFAIAVDARYVYHAIAFSGELLIGQYAELTDDQGAPPAVTLTAPSPSGIYIAGTTVTVRAEASDDIGVSSVTFSADGLPFFTDFAAPFEAAYALPSDAVSATFGATAVDFGGNGTEAQPVTIDVTRNPLPSVSFVAPAESDTPMEDTNIVLEATASDDTRVVRVRFLVNGTPVSNVTTPPYRVTYHVPVGASSLEIVAEAQDNLGQTTAAMRTVAVTPDPPPLVAILAPIEGTAPVEGATATLEATASDNVQVAGVELFLDGVSIGTRSLSPYAASFRVPLGQASIEVGAEAVDNLGRHSQRATRMLSVEADPPPTVALTAPADGTTLTEGDHVSVEAAAADNVRVTQVKFMAAGRETIVYAQPYVASMTVPVGATSFVTTAEATDNLGRISTATREFAVNASEAHLFVEPLALSFSLPAQRGPGSSPRATSSSVTPDAPHPHRPATAGQASGVPGAVSSPADPEATVTPGASVDARLRYVRMPLHFEAHPWRGRAHQAFVARGAGYSLAMTPGEIQMRFDHGRTEATASEKKDSSQPEPLRVRFSHGRMSRVVALDELPGKSSYFHGTDRRAWRTELAHYERVRYEQVYPGVDVVFYGNQNQLEYDVVLAPGADLEKVRLVFKGAKGLSVDERGDLILRTKSGDLRQLKPIVYQEVDGVRHVLDGRYAVKGRDQVGFEVAAYDVRQALVIDPVLSYATYLGGSGSEDATAIHVDATGAIYVTGSTPGLGFPVTSGRAYGGGTHDAYVTKLSADGSTLVYSTYLGGDADDRALALAVDSSGAAYVTGSTLSTNFPVVGGVQSQRGGGTACGDQYSLYLCTDAFVTKLSASSGAIVYSTYLGGNDEDQGRGIAVDAAGGAYVVGNSASPNFPLTSPIQSFLLGGSYPNGRSDGFISRLNPQGSALTFSTYFGGTRGDSVAGVALGTGGDIYVAGSTRSVDFPTYHPRQGYAGSCPIWYYPCNTNTFVARLTPARAFVYSTFLGGSASADAAAIVVDAAGSATVGGSVYYYPTDFPMVNPLQALGGYNDGFLTKFTPDGQDLVYSTYLGGQGTDSVTGLALGADGGLYVTGTAGYAFPSLNPMQPALGSADAFVAKVNPSGTALEYATVVGDPTGQRWGQGGGVAVDASGGVFIAGVTTGNLPTRNPFQSQWAGETDAFVARLVRADNVQFERGAYRVQEGAGQFDVDVVRGDAGDYPLTVTYATVNGTGTAPFDYQAVSGTLTFGSGESRASITIPVVSDSVPEQDETLFLELNIVDPPQGVVYGQNRTALLTIANDDDAPPRGTRTQSFVVRDRVRPTGPNWEAAVSVPWLTLSEYSGTGPSTVEVTADPTGLPVGFHTGTITITAPGADSPQVIQVGLQAGTDFFLNPQELTLRSDDPAGTGKIETVAGGGQQDDGGQATEADIGSPTAVAVDNGGNLYVAATDTFRVRRVASDGTITTIVGTGADGDSGDGGPASAAEIGQVNGLAVDSSGTLYLSDYSNHRVRAVDATGIITTVAGTGSDGFAGDGGPAIAASLSSPVGLAVDTAGNLLIADAGNNRIRRVDTNGDITTLAGTGASGFYGDGGPAVEAALSFPVSVAADNQGNIYIADVGNALVRRVGSDGIMATVAGGPLDDCGGLTPEPGYDGDGQVALGSRLREPSGVAVDADGVLYIADTGNDRIRRVASGGIFGVAGTEQPGFSGDGGPGSVAQVAGPWSVAVGPTGALYVADTGNGRVRRVDTVRIPAQRFSVQASDGGSGPDWQAHADVPWLAVAPTEGSGPSDVVAFANPAGLAPGDYTGTVTVTADDGLVARDLTVHLVVPSEDLSAKPLALFFIESSFGGGGERPSGARSNVAQATSQTLAISGQPTPGNWELSADVDWLSFSQGSGSGPASVAVSAHAEGFFNSGTETGTITLSSDNGAAPRVISVNLRILACEE